MIIEAPHFRLRFGELRDCHLITHYFQDEAVIGPLEVPPIPFKYTDALKFLNSMQKTYKTNRPEMFVIADRDTDEAMGCVGLHPEHTFNNRENVAEIGYWLGQPFWEKGIMFEATSLLVQKAFTDMGWVELVAQTDTDNIASKKLLKKLGFVYMGEYKRQQTPKRGTPLDACFSLPIEHYKEMHGKDI